MKRSCRVTHELHHLDLKRVEYVFIENVGNLVCPAVYDLGQNVNVVALSVMEGEDKPLKYPTMFAKADLVLLTRLDLLQHLPNTNLTKIYDALNRVMPETRVIRVSAQDAVGVDRWVEWLAAHRSALMARWSPREQRILGARLRGGGSGIAAYDGPRSLDAIRGAGACPRVVAGAPHERRFSADFGHVTVSAVLGIAAAFVGLGVIWLIG